MSVEIDRLLGWRRRARAPPLPHDDGRSVGVVAWQKFGKCGRALELMQPTSRAPVSSSGVVSHLSRMNRWDRGWSGWSTNELLSLHFLCDLIRSWLNVHYQPASHARYRCAALAALCGLSVCVSVRVGYDREPCKNGWTDRDIVGGRSRLARVEGTRY